MESPFRPKWIKRHTRQKHSRHMLSSIAPSAHCSLRRSAGKVRGVSQKTPHPRSIFTASSMPQKGVPCARMHARIQAGERQPKHRPNFVHAFLARLNCYIASIDKYIIHSIRSDMVPQPPGRCGSVPSRSHCTGGRGHAEPFIYHTGARLAPGSLH